jgi:hypothetical protein
MIGMVDPKAQIVVLFGEKYHFCGLTECVHSVLTTAVQMDSNGGRLKFKGERM